MIVGPGGVFPELVVAVVATSFLIPVILYLLTLYRAMGRCSPESRAMAPALVWLLIIPVFNVIWNFVVVLAVSKSLHNEFARRDMQEDPAPGKTIGLAMSILSVVSVIPHLGLIGIACVICWVIYWIKIAGYSAKLKQTTGESSEVKPL